MFCFPRICLNLISNKMLSVWAAVLTTVDIIGCMTAQAVFLCVFNVNISLYDWHVCFCLSAVGADAVSCCLFTAQTARNPEQLPSLSCTGTQRHPVLCHRWDQVSQKMRTLTLLDREIKKKKTGPEALLTRTPCTSWLWKKSIWTGLRSS